MLDVVKDQLDVGLVTGRSEVVDFWRDAVGLRFDHRLPIAKGQVQWRFEERGSIIKVNLVEAGVGEQPSGIQGIRIARAEVDTARSLADPDGNAVGLVPAGHDGLSQLGVELAVRDLDRTMRHYAGVLGFEALGPDRVRCGDTLLSFVERPDAPSGFARADRGWTYLTVQVRSCDAETARVEGLGARVAFPPTTLGEVARISMVADPDGNWLEISQRASLVGPLDAS